MFNGSMATYMFNGDASKEGETNPNRLQLSLPPDNHKTAAAADCWENRTCSTHGRRGRQATLSYKTTRARVDGGTGVGQAVIRD
jgi:hypothetical protein